METIGVFSDKEKAELIISLEALGEEIVSSKLVSQHYMGEEKATAEWWLERKKKNTRHS